MLLRADGTDHYRLEGFEDKGMFLMPTFVTVAIVKFKRWFLMGWRPIPGVTQRDLVSLKREHGMDNGWVDFRRLGTDLEVREINIFPLTCHVSRWAPIH